MKCFRPFVYSLLLFLSIVSTSKSYKDESAVETQNSGRLLSPASPLPRPRSRSKHRRYVHDSSYYDSGRHIVTTASPHKSEKKPPVKVTKPYDPIYYSDSTSYYTDSSERSEAQYSDYVYSTPGAAVVQQNPHDGPKNIEFGGQGEMKDVDVEDELTLEAWAALPNRDELEKDRKNITGNWEEEMHRFEIEDRAWPYQGVRYLDHHYYFTTACYQLGSTYLHAKKHLTDYYRIRYAYHNKKDFEIGYLVHEIVYKYGALLEIFHNVQGRFYNKSRFFDSATPTYMLYMYSNIVALSQTVIHLCNMLHEVENKYAGHYDDDDYYDNDQKKNKKQAVDPVLGAHNTAYYEEKERQRMKRKRLRELAKQEKSKRGSDTYSSTKRTRSPRNFGKFPHHYGWSIEYW